MYVCVFCGTPCTALYRRLTINTSSSSSCCSGDSSDAASSQVSSIKAMSCVNCHRPVDPYTERECLLVTIDCILLRPEAYRHVLYNTQDLSWSKQKDGVNSSNTNDRKKRASSSNNDDDDDDDQEDESDDCDIQNTSTLLYRLARWSIVSTLLHAYLKWETFVQGKQQLEGEIRQEKEEADASFALLYMIFFITSALDLFVQWIAVYGYTRLVARMTTFSSSPSYHRNNAAYQIFLGLLLPTSFQVVCVSVLIWENSSTTRALGSLLIACWQCLALSLITINNPSNSHGDGNNNSNNNNNNNNNGTKDTNYSIQNQRRINRPTTVKLNPLIGMISLILWRSLTSYVLSTISNGTSLTIPCVGFEMEVDMNYVFSSLHQYENYYGYSNLLKALSPPSSSSSSSSSSVLLCLT